MRQHNRVSRKHSQAGAVLFVALILLVIVTLIGVTAARLQTGEEAMARNEHNHQLAMQTAEATLRSAESALWNGIYGDADFAGNANGLFELNWEISNGPLGSYADTPNWWNGTVSKSYAGPALSALPASPSAPQVIIESLTPVAIPGSPLCGAGYPPSPACSIYRITAHAQGGDSTSNSTVQSIFR
jgi:type IV pilus assembly protein PilX